MEILKIENLAKNFYLHNAKKEIHSCQNINFTLEQGQFIGIVGLSIVLIWHPQARSLIRVKPLGK